MNSKSGRCAILFPHGVLFRDEEAEMRSKMVQADVVEAVIGLGPNLFYNSPMEACVVICRSKKPKDRKGKVLFIDAVNEVTRERAQSFLATDHIDHIATTYLNFATEDGYSAVVDLATIAEKQNNLSIPLYVRRRNASSGPDLASALQTWRTSALQLRTAATELFELLETTGEAK
jgi:type I restriction enzyme M protein